MSTLSCSNCKIQLTNDDSMREHYKSEFHRYNIKRHLVNLAPITHEQFLKKKSEVLESRKYEKESSLKCDVCNKTFASKATHKQHMESKKHLDTVSAQKDKETTVQASEEEKKPRNRVTTNKDQSVCLFCNLKSTDVNENLVHMRLAHSFFVSDLKYLKDLNGLLKYLGDKIHKGCLCIYCENHQCKDFKSGEAVQAHMVSKGHCFMKTDEFDEYHKYYDFSKSLEDMHNKMYLGNQDEPLGEGEEYLEMESGSDDEGEEWEDDDSEGEGEKIAEEDEEDDEEGDGGLTKAKKEDGEENGEEGEEKPKSKKRVIRYKVRKVKVLDSGEIQLPNGKILGHRKYKHLYKQFFREALQKNFVKQNYLGYSEEGALVRLARENRLVFLRHALEKQVKTVERFDKDKATLREKRDLLRLGMRLNKIQPHYRNSNPL